MSDADTDNESLDIETRNDIELESDSETPTDCLDDEPCDEGAALLWDLHLHNNKHLKSTKRRRPRIEFSPLHPEHVSHYQKVQLHSRRLVPVPLGPSIPRCDRDNTKEKHARLMLILLKPWNVVTDLKPAGMSWLDAYKAFTQSCHPRLLQIIDNMQVLHECRDSRDDHYAKRNNERRAQARNTLTENTTRKGALVSDELDEEDVLAHLQDINESWSEKNERSSATVDECLKHSRDTGLINED